MKKNLLKPLNYEGLKGNKFTSQNPAFTLAEVLITLAIIGIVAALTIPTVLTNYRKTQYVTGLKKMYTSTTQALKAAMANDGVFDVGDTTLISSIDTYTYQRAQPAFDAEFNKYFKTVKTFSGAQGDRFISTKIGCYKLLGKDNCTVLGTITTAYTAILTDGTIMYVHLSRTPEVSEYPHLVKGFGGRMYKMYGSIEFDINGEKGPNRRGRDLFEFILGQDGMLYPRGGKDEDAFFWNSMPPLHWRWNNSLCGTQNSSDIKDVFGDGCAARIMDEGWQMKY